MKTKRIKTRRQKSRPSDPPVAPRSHSAPRAGELVRAVILKVRPKEEILVSIAEERCQRSLQCEVLTLGWPVLLCPGDSVLVYAPAGEGEPGVILGKTTLYEAVGGRLEAAEGLRLACGDSSIEMRCDGRMLLIGADILLRAKRTVRVKGGTVAIN